MNKSDLVESMAKAAGISKAAAEKGLNGMLDAVTKALKKGDKVTLVGFGTFSVAKRAARQGRNPQTGKMIKIGAKTKLIRSSSTNRSKTGSLRHVKRRLQRWYDAFILLSPACHRMMMQSSRQIPLILTTKRWRRCCVI